ncbi:MAG: hypothetical protein JWN22_798 [Nocardioides sp.]|nr:hypothetical protein [Nocardioides sp.]
MSRPDEPAGTATQVGVALATLAEAWLRDSAYAAVGLFSLAVAFCGFAVADGIGYGVLGIAVGLLAVALPTVAVVRRAPASRVWLAILGGAVLDAAAITLFLTSR